MLLLLLMIFLEITLLDQIWWLQYFYVDILESLRIFGTLFRLHPLGCIIYFMPILAKTAYIGNYVTIIITQSVITN